MIEIHPSEVEESRNIYEQDLLCATPTAMEERQSPRIVLSFLRAIRVARPPADIRPEALDFAYHGLDNRFRMPAAVPDIDQILERYPHQLALIRTVSGGDLYNPLPPDQIHVWMVARQLAQVKFMPVELEAIATSMPDVHLITPEEINSEAA
jgi:hypothetical protein